MPGKPGRGQPNALDKLDKVTRDKCINLLVEGRRGALSQVAKIANVSRQAIADYKRVHLERAQRLAEIIGTNPGNNRTPASLLSEAAARLPAVLPILAAREKRLEALQDRHNRLNVIMTERADDMQTAPGGKSGLLVRQLKQIGSGESAQVVEEYKLDTGLLSEFREHEKQMAIELGQWAESTAGGVQALTIVAGDVYLQQQPEPPARGVTLDLTPEK